MRYLRTNSHEKYFALASDRLLPSLIRLHYPKHTWECLSLLWNDHDRYFVRKPRQHASVSIHALHLPSYASICPPLSKLSKWVEGKVQALLSKTKLFVTHRPMSNIMRLWRRFAMHSLCDRVGEGGREGGRIFP